ncbi:MAG: hypothetical protein ABJA64_01260 [Candidatus Saccharibacteria bacterium]
MFRNIVSNLPFSPALVGQLGFYAKRLRKEEATRRIGLIFTALALIVQSFAVFSPPEAANAASNADFVNGGVSSVNYFLTSYDKNSKHIKDLFNSLGITREEIKDAKSSTVKESGYYNWSMTSLYSYNQGQRSYKFYNSQGDSNTVYNRPMSLTKEGKSPYPVYAGYSKKFGFFAIKKDCGNLITKKRPPADKPPKSSCSKLTATMLSRTSFRFDAKGDISNGAKIKSYTFVVTDSANKTVTSKTVASTSENATYTYERTVPGDYRVSVSVDTSLGKKTDPNCKTSFTIAPPVEATAVCSSLTAEISNRTNVELRGAAATSGGATVSKYTFIIKDSTGKEVSRQVVTTDALTADADTVVIDTPGNYTSNLTVTTSLGDKTDATDCTEAFSIVPPEVCPINPALKPDSPDCQPCPGNPTIWIKDESCAPSIIETKNVSNITQSKPDANGTVAKASDKVSYTVTVENKGLIATTATIKENLQDVLEYSDLIDNGGGVFLDSDKSLSWPTVELQPGDKQSRTFVVQVKSTIPATNTGTSNGTSFDCVMTNTFGNSVGVKIDCPVNKVVVEQVVNELPTTGPGENLLFAGALLSVVVYFYARSRQMNKEVRLIRRDLNAGTI